MADPTPRVLPEFDSKGASAAGGFIEDPAASNPRPEVSPTDATGSDAEKRSTKAPADHRPPDRGAMESFESLQLFAGFEIDYSVPAEEGADQYRPQHCFLASDIHNDPLRGANETHVHIDRSPSEFPDAGDLIAGFRLLAELGRGAFARVYLAEESDLGRRLVALKVSQPEGDEPQILAKLQHTHVMPIYSVRLDTATGLRVLCMPYFGGANLAQILESAGSSIEKGRAGKSLVEALDHISRSYASVSARVMNSVMSNTPTSARATTEQLLASPGSARSARSAFGLAAARRLSPLLSRLVGTPAIPSFDQGEPRDCGDDLRAIDQPSRRFLENATATQAAVWIVARLAEGLDHAHRHGLLHRDLKPSNILLTADGTPMLLDFNLSVDRARDPDAAADQAHRALIGGTLPYMSPEHLLAFQSRNPAAARAVDERSDIYALGLILFEMIHGEYPFPSPPPGTNPLEQIAFMIAARAEVPTLRAVCRRAPLSLDALVGRCLAFEPADRYARAGDLAEDLRRFLDNRPMKYCREPSLRERAVKWTRRHPAISSSTSIALCACLLLMMLGGLIALAHDRMQNLAARVRVSAFDRDFAECQFLLHSAGASNEHLEKGRRRAGETLEYLGLDPIARGPAAWRDWSRRLPELDRARVRSQVVELMMLDAGACAALASKSGSESDRRRVLERALARLDQAERLDTRPPAVLYAERSRYHELLGHTSEAKRDRELAASIPRATCHDWTLSGTTLLARGDLDGAEAALRQALMIDASSFSAWFAMGHCHFRQERFLEAAGDFGACVARGPDFAWTHFNRGLSLAKAGRTLDAKIAYDRAIELDPRFAEALVDRALAELELGQIDPARADLARALELGRRDPVVLVALGETYARLGDRNQAEEYFGRLLAADSGDSMTRVARGISRVRVNPEGATADLRAVLDREPGNAHANFGLALIVRDANPTEAIAHLDRALASDPQFIDALQLRALVRGRIGDPEALDDVQRLVESPTPRRLYNAACAIALLAEKDSRSRLRPRAIDLLARAIRAGFPLARIGSDPDLASLRSMPDFRRLVKLPPNAENP